MKFMNWNGIKLNCGLCGIGIIITVMRCNNTSIMKTWNYWICCSEYWRLIPACLINETTTKQTRFGAKFVLVSLIKPGIRKPPLMHHSFHALNSIAGFVEINWNWFTAPKHSQFQLIKSSLNGAWNSLIILTDGLLAG